MNKLFEVVCSVDRRCVFMLVAQSGVGKSVFAAYLNQIGVRCIDVDFFATGCIDADGGKGNYISAAILTAIRAGDVIVGSSTNIGNVIELLSSKWSVYLISLAAPSPELLVNNLRKRVAENGSSEWIRNAPTETYDPLKVPRLYGLLNFVQGGRFLGAFSIADRCYSEASGSPWVGFAKYTSTQANYSEVIPNTFRTITVGTGERDVFNFCLNGDSRRLVTYSDGCFRFEEGFDHQTKRMGNDSKSVLKVPCDETFRMLGGGVQSATAAVLRACVFDFPSGVLRDQVALLLMECLWRGRNFLVNGASVEAVYVEFSPDYLCNLDEFVIVSDLANIGTNIICVRLDNAVEMVYCVHNSLFNNRAVSHDYYDIGETNVHFSPSGVEKFQQSIVKLTSSSCADYEEYVRNYRSEGKAKPYDLYDIYSND